MEERIKNINSEVTVEKSRDENADLNKNSDEKADIIDFPKLHYSFFNED